MNTWHTARALTIFMAISFVCLQAYAISKGKDFNAQDFGIGFGAILTGLGFSLAGEKFTRNSTGKEQ